MRRHIALVLGSLLLVVLAACGSAADRGVATAGGDRTSGSAAALSQQELMVKLGQCMRENGLPDFEDPKLDENGEMDMSLPRGVDPEVVEQANEKCREYLPNGGQPEQMTPEDLKKFQAYAKCMRENGVSKFPDPDSDGGPPRLDGIDPESSEVKAANEQCKHHLPGGGGGFVSGGGR